MELRTEIEIEASPEEVWNVLTDFPRYPEWNPFLVKMKGPLRAGERLEVTMSLPDSNKEYVFRPRLLLCEAPRELRWLGHLWFKGLFDGEHFFRLNESGPGITRLVHGEDFSGLFLRLALGTVTEAGRGFAYMNQALKRRVEKR
jgi:hypothetical protein